MTSVQTLLGLRKPPIAIGFLNEAPAGVPAWQGTAAPAGCMFWKKAQEGEAFYTVPADHYNCAVGAHTHGIPLNEARPGQLEQTVGFMVQSGYIAMEEVAGIPTLPFTPAFIAYAPAHTASFPASVIVVAAQPAQAMLLYEAAVQIGAGAALMNTLGRPGCAILPLALQTGTASISLGCKGNRTFTGLPNEEMYVSIPADKWPAVVDQITRVQSANQTMEGHYLQQKAQFGAF